MRSPFTEGAITTTNVLVCPWGVQQSYVRQAHNACITPLPCNTINTVPLQIILVRNEIFEKKKKKKRDRERKKEREEIKKGRVEKR